MKKWKVALLLGLALMGSRQAKSDTLDDALAALRAVGAEGKGNAVARSAWPTVSQAGGADIVRILNAFDGANELAANWILPAIDAVVEHELRDGNKLPSQAIEAFVLERHHDGRGRRIALEILEKIDPNTPKKLIPKMLDDPSLELRRDAVAELVSTGEASLKASKVDEAKDVLLRAFNAARDEDQITAISKTLKKAGTEVDICKHYGFIFDWQVIGPFDNTKMAHYQTAYPPEKEINFAQKYPGKEGEVAWKPLATGEDQGEVDLNTTFGKLKEAVAYAAYEFDSPVAGPAEIRLGCINAWKLWLNGEYVFGQEEYHSGIMVDQYKVAVNLREGKNTILLKICQNDKRQPWMTEWQFQLRVCDSVGTPILSKNRPATRPAKAPKKETDEKESK